MRRLAWWSFLAFLLAVPASADEDPQPGPGPGDPNAPADEPGDDVFELAPDPQERPGPDADLYLKAVALQQEGKYRPAQKAFLKLLKEFPDSPYADEAEDRSTVRDGCAFLGYTPMNALGPPERRIDVALMGDGYLFEDQATFDKAAVGHIAVLMGEPVYREYASYFNFYRYNLASKDTGVDEVARAAAADVDEVKKQRRKKKKRALREFATAIDCKAAGPAGQVMANPIRVYHYLSYLKVNDGLAICFAQRGSLGMGGGGIATTGPRGVVVHEFGHAFIGLLDEYSNNPGEPGGFIESPNTTGHPDAPPWKHFLDQKVPGVGVYEGGATFYKGVWKPATGCAMNVGGSTYCPVCREAGVLMIYSYVSPIDEALPAIGTVRRDAKGWPTFQVVPMRPAEHELEVSWFLDQAPVTTPTTSASGDVPTSDEPAGLTPLERRMRDRHQRRSEGGASPSGPGAPVPFPFRPDVKRRATGTASQPPPKGKELKVHHDKRDDGAPVFEPVLPPNLLPGHYLLTAVVRDTTRFKGERFPWVLKDDRGLLEDRVSWTLEVPDDATPEHAPPR